jgi:hypothetical protein
MTQRESLGWFVRDQFERSIRNMVSARTQEMMASCFPQLEDAIEELCPVAMTAGPKGVAAAYGPAVGKAKRLLVFATSTHHLSVAVQHWPTEVAPVPAGTKHAELWATIADAVDDDNIDLAMTAFLARVGLDHIKVLESEMERARASRITPIIVVLAAKNKQDTIACGGVQVCALPSSLEAQIARIEGTDQ